MPVYTKVAGTRAGIWPSWAFLCYLLHDGFPVELAAPLVSPHVSSPGPGQLILDQTDGQFSIVAGEFNFPVQGTPVWGDQDFYALDNLGVAYARVLGRPMKWRVVVTTTGNMFLGWNQNNNPTDYIASRHCILETGVGGGLRPSGADWAVVLRDLSPALNNYWQGAITLSPYTSTGLHWYPGAGGTFNYGAHFFFRDESGDDSWRLIWYRQLYNDDPLWPSFSNWHAAGRIDHFRIPCNTYEEELFTPIAWDEFTDINGALLPVHAITYGPTWSWVSDMGIWIITGNKADPNAASPAIATIHTVTPDVWVEVATDEQAAWIGLTLRKSADTSGGTNHWMCYIKDNEAGTDTYITEFNDGAQTHRASADNDWGAQEARNVRVRADGLQITLYVDYVEELHYASAWFNRHATWHGLYAQSYDAARFDNFIILPRGTGLTRICYDDFTHINGTGLDTTTTEEGVLAWVELRGDWDIQTNEARCSTAVADVSRAVVESGVSDAWITARIFLATAGIRHQGLVFRMSEDTGGGPNQWVFVSTTGIAGTDTYLKEYDGGVTTNRATADIDPASARIYFDAHCLGDDITCYMDGTQVLQYLTATVNQTATRHGLYQWYNDNNARWDQFRVTEIPALGEYDEALDSF